MKEKMDVLESIVEKEQKRNRQQIDSLEVEIGQREQHNRLLRDSLARFEQERELLKRRTDENKAAILHIRDVDSLRNAVARHYR